MKPHNCELCSLPVLFCHTASKELTCMLPCHFPLKLPLLGTIPPQPRTCFRYQGLGIDIHLMYNVSSTTWVVNRHRHRHRTSTHDATRVAMSSTFLDFRSQVLIALLYLALYLHTLRDGITKGQQRAPSSNNHHVSATSNWRDGEATSKKEVPNSRFPSMQDVSCQKGEV